MGSYSKVEPLVIGLGVEKAATTWMHRQLENHPEVATTYTKELSYWLKHYDKGPQWYLQQFEKNNLTKVFAEYTPNYILQMDTVLQRISSNVHDVKFILALRNPFERAFSHYLDSRRNGTTNLPFELACTADSGFVKKGLYVKGIKTFLNYYDISKLHVILFDDINESPQKVVAGLYKFIGVSDSHISKQLNKKVNVGSGTSKGSIYLKKLELLAKQMGFSRKHFVHIGLGNVVDRCKAHLSKKNPKPSLTSEQVMHMKIFFEEELNELSKLINRDLSSWSANSTINRIHNKN